LVSLAHQWHTKIMIGIRNPQHYEKRTTRDSMRETFLGKVIEIKPSVISDLAKDVFPVSQCFDDSLKLDFYDLPKVIADLVKSNYDFDKESLSNDFEKAICLWAKKYNFFDGWIFLEVLATLESWKQTDIKDKWTFAREIRTLPIRGYKLKEKSRFEFIFETYNPSIETRIDYKNKLKQQFDIRLQKYLECRESENQTSKAFSPRQSTEEIHLTWLIQHQICGMTYDKIAEKDPNGMELRKISEAINRLAKLIDLTLRDAPNRKRMKH